MIEKTVDRNGKAAYRNNSPNMQRHLDNLYEQTITDANWTVFKNTFAGLTKSEVLQNDNLKKIWVYWYFSESFATAEGCLPMVEEIRAKRIESAGLRLNRVLYALWKLAHLDDDGIEEHISRLKAIKAKIKHSQMGELSRGVDHLRKAAICFGFEPDYFIRTIGVNDIPRFEAENDWHYKIRKTAVEINGLMFVVDYRDSRTQAPSIRTNALRIVWPLLDIDVPTLKWLFRTESGSNLHGAAIRSILKMASPEFALDTKYISNFLKSEEKQSK